MHLIELCTCRRLPLHVRTRSGAHTWYSKVLTGKRRRYITVGGAYVWVREDLNSDMQRLQNVGIALPRGGKGCPCCLSRPRQSTNE